MRARWIAAVAPKIPPPTTATRFILDPRPYPAQGAASNFVPVRLARGLPVDDALREIALDRGGVALRGCPVTAGARRDDFEPLPRLKARGVAFEHDASPPHDAAPRARVAAEQAPRARAQAREFERHAALGLGAIDPAQPHAAAEFARPARAVDQLVAQERERVFDFQRLGGEVCLFGGLPVAAVESVLLGARPAAPADGLEINPDRAVAR